MATQIQGGLNAVSQQDQPISDQIEVDSESQPSSDVLTKEEKPSIRNMWDTVYQQTEQSRKMIEEQIARSQAALERRTNLPFDPALMKLAAGLLAPTRTGSFGESLGTGIGAYADESQKQLERNQQIEAMKLDLAMKGLALQQQNSGMQLMGSYLSNRMGPANGQVSPVTVAGMDVSGNRGTAPPTAAQVAAMPQITQEQVLAAQASGNPQIASFFSLAYKMQQDQQKQDMEQQKIAQGDFVSHYVPGFGEAKLSTSQVSDLNAAMKSQDPSAIQKWYSDNGLPFNIVPGPNGAMRFMTPTELEAQKATMVEQGKASGVRGDTNFLTPAETADDRIQAAKDLTSLAKSNPTVFNALKGYGLTDVIGRAITNGIKTPVGSIGIDLTDFARTIDAALDKSGKQLTQADHDALQMAAQTFARLQIASSKLAQGQGAISDYERHLFENMGAASTDSAPVLRMKSEALQRRAEFDKEVADAWITARDRGQSAESFKYQSPVYKAILKRYNDDLHSFREANASYFSGNKTYTPKSQSAESSSGTDLWSQIKGAAQ
jgi:hypothetical protein